MPLALFLAQIGPSELVDQQRKATEAIAATWDSTWNDVFLGKGGVYPVIVGLSGIIALCCLLFFMVNWFGESLEAGGGGSNKTLGEIMWIVFVVSLLAGGGLGISNLTLGIRGWINQANEKVLESTTLSVQLKQAYKQATGEANAQKAIGLIIDSCQGKASDKQLSCLKEAKTQVDKILAQSRINNDGFADKFGNYITGIIDAAISGAVAGGPVDATFSALNALWRPANEAGLQALMLAIQFAFSNLIEMSALLVGLMGPLAVAGSLLPIGGKPIYAWLTGLISLALAKLSFNIVVGLIATVVVTAGVGDSLWFPIFLGIFSPILAIAISSFGGFAVFQGITSAGAEIIKIGAGVR